MKLLILGVVAALAYRAAAVLFDVFAPFLPDASRLADGVSADYRLTAFAAAGWLNYITAALLPAAAVAALGLRWRAAGRLRIALTIVCCVAAAELGARLYQSGTVRAIDLLALTAVGVFAALTLLLMLPLRLLIKPADGR